MKISERPGVCQELGTRLIQQQEKLFELWHRVRDGTLTRGEFVELASYIRREIIAPATSRTSGFPPNGS